MVLRIERASDRPLMILRVSGQLQSEHVVHLRAQIDGSTQKIILDLEGVNLVDRDVVRFLGLCEASGVQLSQCSPYIRDWIDRERVSQGGQGQETSGDL